MLIGNKYELDSGVMFSISEADKTNRKSKIGVVNCHPCHAEQTMLQRTKLTRQLCRRCPEKINSCNISETQSASSLILIPKTGDHANLRIKQRIISAWETGTRFEVFSRYQIIRGILEIQKVVPLK